jgi:hypothetical protein
MTRRTNPDPMPMLRLAAVARVNEHFNRRHHERAHLDHAHASKRAIAAAVMAGEPIADDHPFAAEAELRGLNLADFAQVVANKPDHAMARELERQQAIHAIEAAATPAELDSITARIG